MLRAILNKSWWQHTTKHQQFGYLPPITKIIQVRRSRLAGHCWREQRRAHKWCTPMYLPHRAKAGRPARTYTQQLCEDTGCSLEDLPEVMNDREKWWERVRDIRAGCTTWWWLMMMMKTLICYTDREITWILIQPWTYCMYGTNIFADTVIFFFHIIIIKWFSSRVLVPDFKGNIYRHLQIYVWSYK